MARTKARWSGRILRQMFREGGSVVLMARIDQDPDRIVELRVNRSSVEGLCSALVKAAELEAESSSGKHHIDEF